MGRKRGRVPDVLWTQFRDKAATLSKTILSFIPQKCNCKGKSKSKTIAKCLRCRVFRDGNDALAYLVRPDDPAEYTRFMSTCFVVIPPNSPPLSPLVGYTRQWFQLQIVERAIQTCSSNNLICEGYQKFKLNSAIVKTLTSLPWELALKRVGDGVMFYLLVHTSIFIPGTCNAHYQVTGPPMKELAAKFPVPSIHQRHQRKRKRNEVSNCEERPTKVSFRGNQPIQKLNDNLGKRMRLPSWQRRKRQKRLTQDYKLLCSCCSVLQSLSRVSQDAEIERKFMLYNLNSSSSLFLGGHVLYSLKADDLLQRIFVLSTRNFTESCFHEEGTCSNKSSCCIYHSLIKLLEGFRSRAEKCKHIRLLKKHCSSATKDIKMEHICKQDVNHQMPKRLTHTKTGSRKTTEVIQSQFGLNRPYCLKDEVVSFVWSVCRSIVPQSLLGLSSFRKTLRRNISRFIRLRRFEKFSLRQCLHKLDVSKFPLLSNSQVLLPNSSNIGLYDLNQRILERWIFWLFSHFIVPLIQAKFYVTESEHGKQNLYYYRKEVWRKIMNNSVSEWKDQNYRCLDNASVAKILSKRSFGFSKVRLCPKENVARPIANLGKPSKFCIKRSLSCAHLPQKKSKRRPHSRDISYFKPVNTVLQDLHVIFKDLKAKEPERWGSTVFSYDDIHRKLSSFLRHLKQGQPTMPEVYIVVSDVQKAYDTVNQDKLLSILNAIPMEDKYSLQKSLEVFCQKKSLRTFEYQKLMIPGNSGCPEVISPVQRMFHTIVVNQEQSMIVRSEKLKFNLKEHLKNNVLKLGRYFFLQTVGIPQGSVLSTLLCTLYYGHMERNIIYPYLEKSSRLILDRDGNVCLTPEATSDACISSPKYSLLRLADDYLFISTSKEQASSFFSRLRRGFRKYNCYMNQEKFGINFDAGRTCKLDSKRRLVGKDGDSFMQWSGLLINSCNLEVQADYTRYLNDHLKSTLTVNWHRRPGRELKRKLCAYMRPKCHPIFFDTNINSSATIRLNVYQAFLVCAMKFHSYVCELSNWCQISAGSCFSSIEGSIRYMYRLMNRRMYKVQFTSNSPCVLEVTKKEVIWLGLTAYIEVLSKKKSRHRDLLPLLRCKAATLSRLGNSSMLKYAVDKANSCILWTIKY